VYSAMHPLQWYLEVYPQLEEGFRPLEAQQEPGEMIFVPGGWWHSVLNLEESVAITENMADSYNFNAVWFDISNSKDKDLQTFSKEFHKRFSPCLPHLFEEFDRIKDLTEEEYLKEMEKKRIEQRKRIEP